ncbi:PilZ domain-containing protein [Rhizobiaceae bacterium CRRU44]|uniref:PilZ domain-containing protein n=2 Tax=Ferranicluibacter rubi TaxID=2715133 RepID=A0AA43ZF10_9HYPH|nr:PilZ domain-containing protein [Ferranicluibacter rubi]
MEEHRHRPRMRTFKSGRLVFNEGSSTLDCVVRNISDGGAKLSFNQVAAIPDVFQISLSDGAKKTCRIVWRKSLDVGVSFEVPGETPPSAESL